MRRLAALGTAGSVLVALTGPALADRSWWFAPAIGGARPLFYAGIVLLSVAWLGLGSRPDEGPLWPIAVLWALPLALGPVLFSRDVYSYLAQGELLHLGLNPYHDAPVALAAHGQGHLLAAVSPFWRHTTAPYGPLFLGLVSPVIALTGGNLIVSALLVRLVPLAGIALLGVYVPRLAGALGADGRRASWLVALSPLTLLGLVAAGHNDALMAGLMAAGVALALDGRTLVAVAVCAVAAAIKLPAAAAAVFIAVAAARQASTPRAAARVLVASTAVAVAVLAVISVVTGVDAHWLTTTVFSTPQKVRIAITPATAVGYTVASVLHDLGATASARSLESAFGALAGALTVGLAALLLWRVRRETLVRYLGIVLLAAAIGGPAAWPWYLIWGFALLAACPGAQRSWAFAAAVVVPAFLVKPDGILALPRDTSPVVLAVYAVLCVLAWRAFRRGGGRAAAVALT
jgi:alpha-1,6-mannosyltransferase